MLRSKRLSRGINGFGCRPPVGRMQDMTQTLDHSALWQQLDERSKGEVTLKKLKRLHEDAETRAREVVDCGVILTVLEPPTLFVTSQCDASVR